ncbi:hypothetical protein A3Q56_05414 [Intoshia linei]|uniref:NADH dehydrogenase [ubiquinone] 1 alpha subcomplex subunit 5 n=1 Tax=Intoshia linei TaxID=1819745 RepID=A0A177AXX3_9BILA|nr:hypothetical protein A3Q56_05414 [Intoshia linei]
MSKYIKKSTYLTGLKVLESPIRDLKSYYAKILNVLSHMPSTAFYRIKTEEIINKQLKVVNSTDNVEEIEKQLKVKNIEEIAQQVEYELHLSRKILKWKPWERLISEPPINQWKWPLPSSETK